MSKRAVARLIVGFMAAVVCFNSSGMQFAARAESIGEETAYYSGIEIASSNSETITYHHKTTEEYSIPGDLPTYHANQSANNCANVAGTILIAYYDRFHEELIPNFQTYIKLGTVLKYKSQSQNIRDVIEKLYSLMGTNVGEAGTTFNGFQTGMRQYASENGSLSYKTENLKKNGQFEFSKYKSAVVEEIPAAFFMSEYVFVSSIDESSNQDNISALYSSTAHVVAACGYRVDTYYNASGDVISTRRYIKAASGLAESDLMYEGMIYFDIDRSEIDESISVMIQ